MEQEQEKDKQKVSHLAPWRMLSPKPNVCQMCAVDHKPEEPHNPQSLHYQYKFYDENGRWPTWADAMAHCSDEMKAFWKEELKKHNVIVE